MNVHSSSSKTANEIVGGAAQCDVRRNAAHGPTRIALHEHRTGPPHE